MILYLKKNILITIHIYLQELSEKIKNVIRSSLLVTFEKQIKFN